MILITLLVQLLLITHVLSGCQDTCCPTSTCNKPSSCCDSSCQTNSKCCNRCDIQCRTTSCVDQCKTDCCCQTTTTTTRTTLPFVVPTIPIATPTNVHNSNINKNEANFTLGINNTVNNENHIDIPVTVNNHNINDVVVLISKGEVAPPVPTTSAPLPTFTFTTSKPFTQTTPTTQRPTTTERCYPYDNCIFYIPAYNPVPYPPRIPQPFPYYGCCNVYTPCATGNCYPYYRTCGNECRYPFQYRR